MHTRGRNRSASNWNWTADGNEPGRPLFVKERP
jgi:hypothetical protein